MRHRSLISIQNHSKGRISYFSLPFTKFIPTRVPTPSPPVSLSSAVTYLKPNHPVYSWPDRCSQRGTQKTALTPGEADSGDQQIQRHPPSGLKLAAVHSVSSTPG